MSHDSTPPRRQGANPQPRFTHPASPLDARSPRKQTRHPTTDNKAKPSPETGALVLNGLIGRRLLDVREAALYLGLSVDTVYKKARLRELPCVKVGRSLRFDLEALQRFVEQHTIETID